MNKAMYIIMTCLCGLVLAGCAVLPESVIPAETTCATTTEATTETTEPAPVIERGYIAALRAEVAYCDEAGTVLGNLIRGTQVEYIDSTQEILLDGSSVYLQECSIVSDEAEVIPAHTLYVRSAVNLRDEDGKLLEAFADKGAAVEVTGYDYLENGVPHMYKTEDGFIMPWYLTDTEEAALANYDDGHYATHADRSNRFGGGSADNLDYYPREKGPIEGNVMPDECRTLYVTSWRLAEIDQYIEIADGCGINAFLHRIGKIRAAEGINIFILFIRKFCRGRGQGVRRDNPYISDLRLPIVHDHIGCKHRFMFRLGLEITAHKGALQ